MMIIHTDVKDGRIRRIVHGVQVRANVAGGPLDLQLLEVQGAPPRGTLRARAKESERARSLPACINPYIIWNGLIEIGGARWI